MQCIEKREFLARVIGTRPGLLGHNSDLLQSIKHGNGIELTSPDKLAAIQLDRPITRRVR